jgi:hypothetical protein
MDSIQRSEHPTILLVKLGTHPEASGIAAEIHDLIPGSRIVGIETDSSTVSDIGIPVIHENLVVAIEKTEWWTDHVFVDPQIYEKVRVYEGQWIRMMERLPKSNRRNGFLSLSRGLTAEDIINRRFQVINRSIAMWDRILRSNSVDALIFQNIPHNFWDAILFRVAQARGLPVLIFHINTRPFLDAIYIYQDLEQMGNLNFGRALLETANSQFGLVPDSSTRVERMSKNLQIGPLGKTNSTQLRPPTNQVLRNLGRLTKFHVSPRAVINHLSRRRIQRRQDQELKSVSSDGPIPERYFIIELQRPGNATSLVKGTAYADPYQMISHIASCLPSNWNLVVRESARPRFERRPRPRDFWRQLASIPRIYIAHPNSDLENLLASATGVVELGYSTLAMRAISQNRPVIVLGLTHLKNVPNAYVVEDFADMSEIFRRVVSRKSTEDCQIENPSIFLSEWIQETAKSTIEGNLTTRNVFGVGSDEYRVRLVKNTARVIAAWYFNHARNEGSSLK